MGGTVTDENIEIAARLARCEAAKLRPSVGKRVVTVSAPKRRKLTIKAGKPVYDPRP